MIHYMARGLTAVMLLAAASAPAAGAGVGKALPAPPQLAQGQDTLPSLSGTVRTEGSDAFLLGAIVELRQESGIRRSRVGQDGGYGFDDLQPGRAELVVFHLAAHPLETGLELPARGHVELNLVLRNRVIPVAGLLIRAAPELNQPVASLDPTDPGRIAIGLRSLDASSGFAESGLTSALSTDEPGEPGGVLYTRGSTVDGRLVLLDGAPILTPFHVAGLVEPFDTRLLRSAELYVGGAPSPYAGAVSYLLDVETRSARRDRPGFTVGADGLTLDLLAETPLPMGGSMLLGGRLLHGLQESLDQPDGFPYGYDDLLVRAGVSPAEGHDIRVTGFRNHESVRLDLGADSRPAEREATWGNRALSARYQGRFGLVRFETTAATSTYESTLPVSWEDPVLASGTGERARLGGSARLPVGQGSLRMGASVERLGFGYDLNPVRGPVNTSIWEEAVTLGTTEMGAFGEWEGSLGSALTLRAGVRGDHYSHEGRLRVSPRVGLRLSLGDRVQLFGAAGRYHQVLPAPGLQSRAGADGGASALGWAPSLPVASASHLVVGLEQELDQGVRLSLSGFAKGFSGLGHEGADRSRSSGTEIRVSRDGNRLRGWFGYALSWFWVEEGTVGSTRFDGRHLLSLGLEGTVPGGVELSGALGYGAGLPMTAVGLPSQTGRSPAAAGDFQAPTTERVMNSGGGGAPLELAPEGDFLRMDFEVAWPIERQVAGRRTELRPYVKILNALNRRDALFYYFDRWHGEEVRPLATRPFLPLVGLRWQF